MENCGICGKPGKHIYPTSFIPTCIDHTQYASVGMPEVVQKELGIISEYPEKMQSCFYCKAALTEDEINGIRSDDQNVCCSKHTEVRAWVQIDMAKAWLRFKELFTEAQYSDTKWFMKFREWWRKNSEL